MSSVITKVYEALKSLRSAGSVIIPEKTFGGKVYPKPTFKDMNAVHLGDPDVRSAIDFIADVAVGTGFQTSMNEQYEQKTSPDHFTAKELIDYRCKEFGIDELMQETTRDLVGYGNSLLWKGNPEKIEFLGRLSPGTIEAFLFDKQTGLRLEAVKTTRQIFPAEELTWLYYNRISLQPIGTGILQTLCTALKTKGGTRPPFAEIKARIQKAMTEQIENFSAYNELWVFEGVSDSKLAGYNIKIQQMKKGKRIVTNKPGKVIQAIPERMRGLDFYAETLWNSFYLALATPYPKLVLGGGPGFTEASARAAVDIGERKIFALQRYIKRIFETQIFDQWIREEGLDPIKAEVRLNWRLAERPKMETLLPILDKARDRNDITVEEFRQILINIGVDIERKRPET